ncbi:MAG: amino acid-binding protein [Rhodospirillaceae bacterium]|nr:amino acid-binding protein [Rhodospirillaceae bacterium]
MSTALETPSSAIVSIKGPDKVGLISAISGRLFDLGVNLSDTAFTVLGGNAEFSAVCELHGETDINVIKAELNALDQLSDSKISVSHLGIKNELPASKSVTHNITISGGDRPGLLALLCEVFQQFGANIVQLNSEHRAGPGGGQYVISAAVSIPPDAAKTCLAHISNTAGDLGLNCEWIETKE